MTNLNDYRDDAHEASCKGGWWDEASRSNPMVVPAKLCLIHSEISEAMEGHRKGLNDDHLPHRLMVEVELADTLLRIFDIAGFLGLDLEGAYQEKKAYNARRADHKTEARQSTGGKAY